jgi:hypothetical protein
MNASRWFNYFSFDMMGDMAFGKSFDMLKTGETVRSIPKTTFWLLTFYSMI